MEPLFWGKIIWYEGAVLLEKEFEEGWTNFGADSKLMFEHLEEPGGWRLRILMQSSRPVQLHTLKIVQTHPFEPQDMVFINGYQSWTESREFSINDSIPKMGAPFQRLINTTGDYTFYEYPNKPGRLHSWSFATLRRDPEHGTLWRDAVPETGYTLIEFNRDEGQVVISKDVGGLSFEGEKMMVDLRIRAFKGTELSDADFEGCQARPILRPASGWTSWYNYYTKIDEQIIMDNLRAFAFREVPLDFFQIDDGWQVAVGDWLQANEKFPQGMAYLAQQIQRNGYKAGLWLAPLIVEQKSSIYQNHRDWLLSHDGEQLVEAGYNPGWGGLMNGTYYVLNLDLPEVREHLREVFKVILQDWAFDLVKLDFLFAGGLIPANGKSRGIRMQEAFSFLRECCGDKLILGCGVPLASAWGQADYCRIGADIGLDWDMKSAKLVHMRERISTRLAIEDSISRRHFSGRYFGNDPDVFILRKKNNDLSPNQQQTLLAINHIFGDLLFTSDDIASYDSATMQRYLSTFPHKQKKIKRVEHSEELYQIWFEVEGRKYYTAANLSRLDKKLSLPGEYMYRNGEGFVDDPKNVYLKPFETRIYLIMPEASFGCAGSDLHLFPGCEIKVLENRHEGIHLELEPECKLSGTLLLKVPEQQSSYIVNGKAKPVRSRPGLSMLILEVKDGQLA